MYSGYVCIYAILVKIIELIEEKILKQTEYYDKWI